MDVVTKPQAFILLEQWLDGRMVKEWLVNDLEDLANTVNLYQDLIKGIYRIIEIDGIPTLQRLQ